ncbi:MFS transporter, SP family, sugar:H+ symporter [Fusarium oxysporum f. sp. lycopersici 4287]|uniref:MFS transporter, SP family, sugar:H+ symporter n=2 Tax=Fusarium oxysporum TaxID=5507 RepID=A0A0J9WAV1_FUSO4|nr:MFS transporter, SP family, sugar:H+ symporter [Fusarium oxysporum f. sp. lycopersici 4287]EXK27514.1 MFS transporter, SP family, sugar:H+ symporter [Fusarium oxysporum f. sp. melonis 26406]KAJ9417955.1 MFS transporter [Fusarium oxysporum]KNB20509.1 MFS transporter, SP family, sugar:H+ symporter [Fusarium oxysporum f. sp. lycopersici 4287]
MAGERTTNEQQIDAVPKKGVWRQLRENPYIFGLSMFASLGGFLFGYDQGVVSGVLTMESFAADFPRIYLDSSFKGWFVSTLLLCAWFGSLINGPIADYIGRKGSILLAVVVFTIGSAFQAGADSIPMLFAGRAVAGLAVGMLTMIVPMYMSEVSSPGIRGTLVVLQQLSITLGILVSYWLEYGTQYIGGHRCAPDIPYSGGTSDKRTFDPRYDVGPNGCTGQSEAAWRVPFALQIFPALVLGIGMIFFPESPRFYLMRHKEDQALAALAQLRQVHVDSESIRAEYLAIKTEVLFDESVSAEKFPGKKGLSLFAAQHVALVSTWPAFKRLAIGCCIMFFQQFMGCNAIIYYAPTMFAQLGLSGNTSGLLATGVYGIVNTLSTLPALFLIDKLGRRPLLMCGAAGTFVSLVIVGGIIGGYGSALTDNKSAGWVGIVFIYIYDVNFSFSFAPIGWVLPSEIFNLGNRSKAMAITTSATWMCNFIIGLVTPDMLATIGWGTYIFFAAFCLLAFLFTYFFVPETRGKSLEDMDLVFGDTASHEEKARLMEIASSMGLTEAVPGHKVGLAKEDYTSAEHFA